MAKEGSPLSRVEQEFLKERIRKIFDEITYITLRSKEKIKLREGKDEEADIYRFRFIFQTVDGKLHKLVWLELEDICNMFNFNFSMKIGRKYTKVELFDYDLLSRYEYMKQKGAR